MIQLFCRDECSLCIDLEVERVPVHCSSTNQPSCQPDRPVFLQCYACDGGVVQLERYCIVSQWPMKKMQISTSHRRAAIAGWKRFGKMLVSDKLMLPTNCQQYYLEKLNCFLTAVLIDTLQPKRNRTKKTCCRPAPCTNVKAVAAPPT